MGQPKYRRVILKISGEGLCKPGGMGLDQEEISRIALAAKAVVAGGTQLGIVVGGGNFIRGQVLSQAGHVRRATGDYMGMLATCINALALQDTLEDLGAPTRVLTAIEMRQIAEPFIRRRAVRHLEKGRIVILAGGTGNPYFTTDTCAALRASELEAEVLMKATKVDGVFTADPVKDPTARKFDRLTYQEVLEKQLGVMDLTAISMCMASRIPIVVFNLKKEGNIARVIAGETIGTTITS
ncbi:MAG TPA: UMP kinase [Phycisphaerae bacterium]|nr:UMP kinase [Phycisphaerae bacterium]HOI54036.1 UMP kinase [Phycisphaerae bacterium]